MLYVFCGNPAVIYCCSPDGFAHITENCLANLTLQKTVDLSKDDLLGDILQDISAEVSMLLKSVGNNLNPLICCGTYLESKFFCETRQS